MAVDIPIGARVRFYREGREMTQVEAAMRAGISLDYMQSIEQGRRLPSGRVLNQLAQVLGVGLDILRGQGQTGPGGIGHPVIPSIHSRLLGLGDVVATTIDAMQGRVELLGDAWFGQRSFESTAALLPDLIGEADYLRRTFTTPQEEAQRRDAARLIYQTYYITRQFARTVGATDVAMSAREHMLLAADATDDPVTIAASRWSLGLQLITDGHLEMAEAVVKRQIEDLRSTAAEDRTRQSLLGMMSTVASIVAIRQGDLSAARRYAEEAFAIATKTGENSIYWSAWGPTNVGIFMTEIEAEHGNSRDGLRLAELVSPDALEGLPVVERRFHYLTMVAWLHDQLDQDTGVMLYLKHALRTAPDEGRYSRLVHQLVRGLLQRTRATYRSDVMDLAQQSGMLA